MPRGIAALWAAFPPTGRAAFLGVGASALIAVALGVFIPAEVQRHVLTAEARGLEAAIAAMAPSLPDVGGGPVSGTDLDEVDVLVDRAILDADHVRAKLWSLDGTIIYSDAHALIGRRYPDQIDELTEVGEGHGPVFEVTNLSAPENEYERSFSELVEFYVPVTDDAGEVVGVFEIYEDVRFINAALRGISTAVWLAIGSGLGVLLIFLVLLMGTTVRAVSRDRAAAEARARDLEVLVAAADALASSLEPTEFFSRLEATVKDGLGLTHLTIEPEASARPGISQHRLRDGRWLIGERDGGAILGEEDRVLRAVADSVDAALGNAALFAEVRSAADARRDLLRQVGQAHEDERRLLVGELHDTLAAELIRLLYGVRGILARSETIPPVIRSEVERLEQLVGDSERGLRAFMNRIRPSSLEGAGGLVAAVRQTVDRFREETGLRVELSTRGGADGFDADRQLVTLRAVEEGLLNVRKHAGAGAVRVVLSADARRMRLTIDDDGGGWPPSRPHPSTSGLGLAYLRERVVALGGRVDLEASRLGGARLVMELPR